MKLGEKIAQLRKDKNMTQSELAEKMCITDKAVSKWERDISRPDVRTIQKLAQIFDVSIEELMGEVTETTKTENKTKNLIMLILRCVGFALAVAVLVMSIIGKLDITEAVKLLALSVTALGLHCILKE
jgi:transcriptional regulator with XRE-family HTH domain